MAISDQRVFYIRIGEKDINGIYPHIPFFKGRLFDKNIWVDEMCEISNLETRTDINQNDKDKMKKYNTSSIINFNWIIGETYSVISGGVVNTHIDWVKRGEIVDGSVRTYVNLTKKEIKELRRMFGYLPLYKRDPYQFWLLITTAVGVIITAAITLFQTFSSNSSQLEQYKQHRELLEIIIKKDIRTQNLIENTVVVDTSKINHTY